ncbi:unnamed protein product, partial [Prorocentrum cordatum]
MPRRAGRRTLSAACGCAALAARALRPPALARGPAGASLRPSLWPGRLGPRRSTGSCPSPPQAGVRRGAMERGLVSCEWLRAELGREYTDDEITSARGPTDLPGSPFAGPEGSSGAQADHIAGPRLPGAVFFDIDGVAAQHPAGLKHMLPSEEMFAAAMAAMGITPTTRVVVYDRHGVFSSPRFWWTLKLAFGHPAGVAVLDGGLPRWKE